MPELPAASEGAECFSKLLYLRNQLKSPICHRLHKSGWQNPISPPRRVEEISRIDFFWRANRPSNQVRIVPKSAKSPTFSKATILQQSTILCLANQQCVDRRGASDHFVQRGDSGVGIMRNLRIVVFVAALGANAQLPWAADVASDDSLGLIMSGQIESWNGYSFYGNESGDTEFTGDTGQFVSSISGRLSVPLGASFALQADGEIAYSSNELFGSEQDDLFQSSYLLGGHMSWRNPSAGLIGGFAAFGGGDHDNDSTPHADFLAVGGEGQFYLDDMTLYVQAGYLDSDNDNDFIRSAGFARGVLRWFFTPDNRLQTELSYVSGTSDSGGDAADTTVLEWSVRYDTVLPNLPVLGDTNVFVGYRGSNFDKQGPDPGGFTDHTVLLGIAHSFGANSVQEMDRTGVALDLPNFGRWVAAGEALE